MNSGIAGSSPERREDKIMQARDKEEMRLNANHLHNFVINSLSHSLRHACYSEFEISPDFAVSSENFCRN